MRPSSQMRRQERRNASKPTAVSGSLSVTSLQETIENVKDGLNMLLWWFSPDSREQYYINPAPANLEQFAAACAKLRTVSRWMRDIAAQTDARLEGEGVLRTRV